MELNDFPVFKTKVEGSARFNLNDPAERRKYFDAKMGAELKIIKEYERAVVFRLGHVLGALFLRHRAALVGGRVGSVVRVLGAIRATGQRRCREGEHGEGSDEYQ